MLESCRSMRRSPFWLTAIAATVTLAGCLATQPATPAGTAAWTRSGALVANMLIPAVDHTASAAAVAAALAAQTGPNGRSYVDRADDGAGFQVHFIYALPADATDDALDTSGTLATSINAMNQWLAGQTGGPKLRLDTARGEPDITFYRSPHTEAQLGNTSVARMTSLQTELELLGFTAQNKLYAVVYGGAPVPAAEASVNGLGWAFLLPKSCEGCSFATKADGADAQEWNLLGSILHALGFVAACAPHHAGSDSTSDNPADLLALHPDTSGAPQLDPGHDDYFGTKQTTCLDLAHSPFLDPLPAVVQTPVGRPLATYLLPGAVAYQPQLNNTNTPGYTDLEARLYAALMSARASAHLSTFTADAALTLAARRLPSSADAGVWESVLAAAGFASHAGFEGISVQPDPDTIFNTWVGSHTFKTLATDAGLYGAGLGVAVQNGSLVLGVVYSHAALQIDAAAYGPGPNNTRTVALQFHSRPAVGVAKGFVYVDDQAYALPFVTTPTKPATVFATLPASGRHQVGLGLPDATGQIRNLEQVFEVNCDAPPAQALQFE